METERNLKLCVVAAERSGDLLGASLLAELRRMAVSVEVFGIGGEALREEGMICLEAAESLAATGISEAFHLIPRALKAVKMLAKAVGSFRPDAIVLIDAPDLNLRVARALRPFGVPVIYYVSPQLWAWRGGRIKLIQAYVSQMLVLFPFEVDHYRSAGVPATWVGHPLVDRLSLPASRTNRRTPATVALLPGSRPNEVRAILPWLVRAAALVGKTHPEVNFLLIKAPSVEAEQVESILRHADVQIKIVEQETLAAMASVDAAWVASGTATLELACLGIPMVVVYRMTWLSYFAARVFVRGLRWMGMVNILAGEELVPEILQHLKPFRLAEPMLEYLTNERYYAETRARLLTTRERLGPPGASARAAVIVMQWATRANNAKVHPLDNPEGANS